MRWGNELPNKNKFPQGCCGCLFRTTFFLESCMFNSEPGTQLPWLMFVTIFLSPLKKKCWNNASNKYITNVFHMIHRHPPKWYHITHTWLQKSHSINHTHCHKTHDKLCTAKSNAFNLIRSSDYKEEKFCIQLRSENNPSSMKSTGAT
jgi:hypothetical protein